MIPRFRAWLKEDKEMIDVDEMHFKNGELDFIGNGITWMYKKSDYFFFQIKSLCITGGMAKSNVCEVVA